jgi:hypothetical protein
MDFLHKNKLVFKSIITGVILNPPQQDSTKKRRYFYCNQGKFKFYLDKNKLNYKIDAWSRSTWWNMLQNEDLFIENSIIAKCFRRRFRVPHELFLQIVDNCKEWYNVPDINPCGLLNPPLSLKILGVLRYLGRGITFDCIAELNGISENTNRVFFHQFCAQFAANNKDKWIKTPSTDNELHKHEETYIPKHFPGAIGSLDVVHLEWNMCPAQKRNIYCGKEGYPTIAYEVCCDHNTCIMSVTPGTFGSMNDKTIVKFDGFIEQLRTKQLFTNYEYSLNISANETRNFYGAYVITDGGYHNWKGMMSAISNTSIKNKRLWGDWLCSVRKDIECVFGRLKKRFIVLKNAINIQNQTTIDNMFVVCCILHNMLLQYDYNIQMDENDLLQEDDDDLHDTNCYKNKHYLQNNVEKNLDSNGLDTINKDYTLLFSNNQNNEGFYELQDALITHYIIKTKK